MGMGVCMARCGICMTTLTPVSMPICMGVYVLIMCVNQRESARREILHFPVLDHRTLQDPCVHR